MAIVNTTARPPSRHLARIAALLALLVATGAGAATDTIRVARQSAIGHLPLQVMREHRLIEKHAAARGLPAIEVRWPAFDSERAASDGLLAGDVDVAAGGVGPLLTIWDRTRGSADVKGVACLNLMPVYLNSRNPRVRALEDITHADRIALPPARHSTEARTLQMAAERAFGAGWHGALDGWTVSRDPADAVAAMLSGHPEITGHVTRPPFAYQELADPRVHKVLSSYDVLDGPSTLDCVWARSSLRAERPQVFGAFLDALGEAMSLIAADRADAARVHIGQTRSTLPPERVLDIVDNPEIEFTMVPANTMKYAGFMHAVGALGTLPASWQDYFFPEVHHLPGS